MAQGDTIFSFNIDSRAYGSWKNTYLSPNKELIALFNGDAYHDGNEIFIYDYKTATLHGYWENQFNGGELKDITWYTDDILFAVTTNCEVLKITISTGEIVKFFDLQEAQYSYDVYFIEMSPDNTQILVGEYDLCKYDVDGTFIESMLARGISEILFIDEQTFIQVRHSRENSSVTFVDYDTGNILNSMPNDKDTDIRAFDYSSVSNRIAMFYRDVNNNNWIRTIDAQTGDILSENQVAEFINNLKFNTTGEYFVCGLYKYENSTYQAYADIYNLDCSLNTRLKVNTGISEGLQVLSNRILYIGRYSGKNVLLIDSALNPPLDVVLTMPGYYSSSILTDDISKESTTEMEGYYSNPIAFDMARVVDIFRKILDVNPQITRKATEEELEITRVADNKTLDIVKVGDAYE